MISVIENIFRKKNLTLNPEKMDNADDVVYDVDCTEPGYVDHEREHRIQIERPFSIDCN